MKRLLLIGGAAGLLLLGMLFGALYAAPLLASANTQQKAVTKTSLTTSAPPKNYCEQFQKDLAQRLGTTVDKLQKAEIAAGQDTLTQMVKDGKLTQAQANKIKQHFSSGQVCNFTDHKGDRHCHCATAAVIQKYTSLTTAQIAAGLHLTSAELTSQLQSGKSLSDVATAQHISTTQLKTIVTNAIQSTLKQAVAAGDLTEAHADTIQKHLLDNPAMLQHILTAHFDSKQENSKW
jgi:AraC-like DNA-binding protein